MRLWDYATALLAGLGFAAFGYGYVWLVALGSAMLGLAGPLGG